MRSNIPRRWLRWSASPGEGPQRDRTWSVAYETGKAKEPVIGIDWVPDVHAALSDSFTDWIHDPICGAVWPTARCRCISSPPETTFARRGPWRSLPRSFRTGGFRPCLACRMTFGSPIPHCGPRPS